MASRLVQRAACRLHPALLLGARAESSGAAAVALNAVDSSTDAILQQLGPVSDPLHLRKLQEAVSMPVQASRGPDQLSPSEREVRVTT